MLRNTLHITLKQKRCLKRLQNKEKDNDLRRPLENFDWLTLQFMFPNQSWTNAENVEKNKPLKKTRTYL